MKKWIFLNVLKSSPFLCEYELFHTDCPEILSGTPWLFKRPFFYESSIYMHFERLDALCSGRVSVTCCTSSGGGPLIPLHPHSLHFSPLTPLHPPSLHFSPLTPVHFTSVPSPPFTPVHFTPLHPSSPPRHHLMALCAHLIPFHLSSFPFLPFHPP